MEFYDAVYYAACLRDITIEKLGLKMGHTSAYIGASKARGSVPKIDTAVKIFKACDYTLCAIPKNNVPEDAIVIEKAVEE